MNTTPLIGAGRTLPAVKVPVPPAGTVTWPETGVIAAHIGSTISVTVQTPAGTLPTVTVPSAPVATTLSLPWGLVRRNDQPGTPGSPASRTPLPLMSSNFTSRSEPSWSATSNTTRAELSRLLPVEKKLTVAR